MLRNVSRPNKSFEPTPGKCSLTLSSPVGAAQLRRWAAPKVDERGSMSSIFFGRTI